MSYCNEIEALIQTYLDDELATGDSSEFERHTAQCTDCMSRLEEERLFHRFVKERLAPPRAPRHLRLSIASALDEEDRNARALARKSSFQWFLPGLSTVTAAAALTLFFVSETRQPAAESSPVAAAAIREQKTIPVSMLRQGSRPELSRAAQQYVRMPVRPPRFEQTLSKQTQKRSGGLRGYLQSQLDGRVAALFVYDVPTNQGTKRVFVHTLDARRTNLQTDNRQMLGDKEIWLTQKQGFSTVAYTDEQGVGYVFSSKLDSRSLVSLVAQSDLLRRVESQQNHK